MASAWLSRLTVVPCKQKACSIFISYIACLVDTRSKPPCLAWLNSWRLCMNFYIMHCQLTIVLPVHHNNIRLVGVKGLCMSKFGNWSPFVISWVFSAIVWVAPNQHLPLLTGVWNIDSTWIKWHLVSSLCSCKVTVEMCIPVNITFWPWIFDSIHA